MTLARIMPAAGPAAGLATSPEAVRTHTQLVKEPLGAHEHWFLFTI